MTGVWSAADGVHVAEASALGLAPGVLPDEVACPECGCRSARPWVAQVEAEEVRSWVTQCGGCGVILTILND